MPPEPPKLDRDLASLGAPAPAPAPRRKNRRPFSPKALFRRLLLVTLLLVALVLAAGMLGKPFARCMTLRHTIKDALASATQVRVIEHSNPYDWPPGQGPAEYHEKVFHTVTLTPEQIAQLRASLPISLDFGQETKCSFQDHHRIEATQPGGETFTLDLCFRCRELSVNGEEKRIFPLRWDASLRKFITSLGLNPEGPGQK